MISYFIRGQKTNLVKIGEIISVSALTKRFSQLRTENADELILLASTDKFRKYELHVRFRVFKHHADWFNCDERIMIFIQQLNSEKLIKNYKPRGVKVKVGNVQGLLDKLGL